ncbi:histidine phosphatase family protein [Rhizobium calliandrae]|uniref:Histidine phosphatase family protein n=1 Tax=Rhizobium calliandrae TaxID=1312182 RepID=A0ABT7KIV9_9HYPH|nr:histidine phosphatase family protein [Rhizobium calliandrae]MDL2408502.1 histidine phosphatase family protein [Rhizobium calliandrae]
MAPTKIYFIRHAEKPDEAKRTNGVLPDGSIDKESLTVKGWQRAGALTQMTWPGTASAPTTIFAAGIGPGSDSKRPQQTVTPLAELLNERNILSKFDTTCLKSDLDGLFARILDAEGVVLVCWEHHLLPDLLDKFPHAPPAPKKWPDDRFDMNWCLESKDGGWSFSQIPQNLLKGDRSDVFPQN